MPCIEWHVNCMAFGAAATTLQHKDNNISLVLVSGYIASEPECTSYLLDHVRQADLRNDSRSGDILASAQQLHQLGSIFSFKPEI